MTLVWYFSFGIAYVDFNKFEFSIVFQYAAWDLAFHMIPMAHVDIQYAKEQLLLMMREWYMHPNGQVKKKCYLLSSCL